MTRPRRERRYVPAWTLILMRPLLRYSTGRNAYVLRIVGNHVGPVLRRDRRHARTPVVGPERRHRTA